MFPRGRCEAYGSKARFVSYFAHALIRDRSCTTRAGIKEDGSAIYELWISGYDTDTDRIIQLMKNWLDQL